MRNIYAEITLAQFIKAYPLETLAVNPLNPKIKIGNLICCPYSFPTDVVGRGW